MSVFADSSALVKLYVDEAQHELVRALSPLQVSALARVEVPAAIWRKERAGELGAEDATVLVAEFEADYRGTDELGPRFAVIALTTGILAAAARHAAAHRLRALDALQLAGATAARTVDPACTAVAAFDAHLRAAAAAEGFALIPTEFLPKRP